MTDKPENYDKFSLQEKLEWARITHNDLMHENEGKVFSYPCEQQECKRIVLFPKDRFSSSHYLDNLPRALCSKCFADFRIADVENTLNSCKEYEPQ